MSIKFPHRKAKLKEYRRAQNKLDKEEPGRTKEKAIQEAFGNVSLDADRQRALMTGFDCLYDWLMAGKP